MVRYLMVTASPAAGVKDVEESTEAENSVHRFLGYVLTEGAPPKPKTTDTRALDNPAKPLSPEP